MRHTFGVVVLSAIVALGLAGPKSRRQPKDTYLQVPKVPDPSSYGLKSVLNSLQFAVLDQSGDGLVEEWELATGLEAQISNGAKDVWRWIDENHDEQLDLQELQGVVGKTFEGEKLTPGQKISSSTWRLLSVLADHFSQMDLSRSARISVPLANDLVQNMLRSVPLLEERLALFDAVAGVGEGDSFGSFTEEDFKKWQAKSQKGPKKASRKKGDTTEL